MLDRTSGCFVITVSAVQLGGKSCKSWLENWENCNTYRYDFFFVSHNTRSLYYYDLYNDDSLKFINAISYSS